MPAPYEEWIISTKSGNCKKANKVTGTEELKEIGTTIHANLWSSTMQKVAANATSIDAIEKKRVARPTTNLFGRDSAKSSSAYREVSMERNINMEVTEENRANASATAKTMKDVEFKNIGVPLVLSLPPGTVKIAANITVVISVATSMHDEAVFFIHFSPSLTSPLCSSVNIIRGVLPFLSLISLKEG